MPQDRFKSYVEANRSEFETSSQDFQEIWRKVEKELNSRSGPPIARWYRVAAAILVLVIAGWTTFNYQSEADMPFELQETEQHYFNLIRVKMEQLSVHQNHIDELIWSDLEALDREYEVLKGDLMDQVDQQEVAQAMIENQRTKLEILDQILSEIESKTNGEDVKKLDI